jgi:predicted dithiol-disulfide oxidoreductase (DUF899 family)
MTEAERLESEIMAKALQLAALRAQESAVQVPDYPFTTLQGTTTLSALFAEQTRLLVIHNMGQGCRYCTVWGDGINGVLRHLEATMAVVVVSKDSPQVQRRLAMDRGWRMRMASHGGGPYIVEQSVVPGEKNFPGAVVYERQAGQIRRRGRAAFGPGDLYSPLWHFLALAGTAAEDFTPQFHYWGRPAQLDDGGADVRDG